jgi:hypothetical protein
MEKHQMEKFLTVEKNQIFGNENKDNLLVITKLVLKSKKELIESMSLGYCKIQRENCTEKISEAIEQWYHPNMEIKEIKLIIENVGMNKSEVPDVTDSVRKLLMEG